MNKRFSLRILSLLLAVLLTASGCHRTAPADTADADTDQHVYPDADEYLYTDGNEHADGYADRDAHQHGDQHAHRDGDEYQYPDGDQHADEHAHRDAHQYADTDADPDEDADADGIYDADTCLGHRPCE